MSLIIIDARCKHEDRSEIVWTGAAVLANNKQ